MEEYAVKPRALVLQARGTNRDLDVTDALSLAGADAVGVPLNHLRGNKTSFRDFQLLVIPGGFSYADALGAGKLLALDLKAHFTDEIKSFIEAGKPVIGICNGFQALIKSGAFTENGNGSSPSMTLTFNSQGHFECRWVTIRPVSQNCIWTKGLDEEIDCPIAHGEGNFQISDSKNPTTLEEQIALTYTRMDGSPPNGEYPANPNGSLLDIAGICNLEGNVLGLMPHPENHIHACQHPLHSRGERGKSGLKLFENGVKYARQM
jgi:phosphoribosylformylglycinamidine synthase